MANAAFSVDDRPQRNDEADAQHEDDGGEQAELMPSVAQLTAAIDPALLASVASLHTRWSQHLATHAPSLTLNQPASAADLHALSSFVASQLPPLSPSSPDVDLSSSSGGVSLPSLSSLPVDLLCCWLCADGEGWSSRGGGVLGNFSLLSARQSLREYQTLCDLLDNSLLPKPASPLAPRFTRSYIPIAASASSHYLLAPITAPSTHQPLPVILLPSDGSRAWRVAPSLHALLGRIVEGLEGSRWRWDDAVSEWTGEGAECFCAVWDEGGKEWDARQDNAVRQYDESALTGLTRDVV